MNNTFRAFQSTLLTIGLACGLAACDDDSQECSDSSMCLTNGGGDQGGGDTGGAPSTGGNDPEGGNGPMGGNSGEWVPLITAEWSLEAGGEITSDIHTITLDRDIYVGGIRPIDPVGTHHTVLALDNFNMGNIIYASGVGTNEVMFPPKVGFKLSAGQLVVLQLHLFNPSPDEITGFSGIEIIEVDEAEVEQEAEVFLPGPLGLDIPPNAETTQAGTCTLNNAQTIFAVFPHMHQLGTHFKTTLNIGGEEQVLHDAAYDFNHQAFYSFDPISMGPGDTITTECTWNNTTPNQVGWGESSTTEMCFSILFRFPKQNDAGFCVN